MADENDEPIEEEAPETEIQDAADDSGVEPEEEKGSEEKTPIPEAQRHLYPAKFKYIEDVVSWGAEAEKAKGRAETERDQIRQDSEDAQGREDDARGQGGPTEAEKQAAESKFQDEWAQDPMGTLQKVLDERDSRNGHANAQTRQQALWVDEDEFYSNEYGKEAWENEVRPALAQIARDRPHLQTLEDALAVYEYGRNRAEASDRQEHDDKQRQKGAAFSESQGGVRKPGEKSVVAKIGAASSMAELEKMRDAAQS